MQGCKVVLGEGACVSVENWTAGVWTRSESLLDLVACPLGLWNPLSFLVLEGEEDAESRRPGAGLDFFVVHSPVREGVLVERVVFIEHADEGLSGLVLLDRGGHDRLIRHFLAATIRIDPDYLLGVGKHQLAFDQGLGSRMEPSDLGRAGPHGVLLVGGLTFILRTSL